MAFNGYLERSKISVTKQNFSTAIKYISAELAKCDLGETLIMNNNLNCRDRKDSYKVSVAVPKALDGKLFSPWKVPGALEGIIHGYFPNCGTIWSLGRISVYRSGIVNTLEISVCTELNGKMIKHFLKLY